MVQRHKWRYLWLGPLEFSSLTAGVDVYSGGGGGRQHPTILCAASTTLNRVAFSPTEQLPCPTGHDSLHHVCSSGLNSQVIYFMFIFLNIYLK